jgi:hypothetical protein
VLKHLLDLLELPEPVQLRISDGSFPQRFARLGVYRAVARLNPQRAEFIADTVGRAPDTERDERFAEALENALGYVARPLRDWSMKWKTDWKPDPKLVAALARPDKGEPNPLPSPSCSGCPFNLSHDRQAYCVQPSCFHFKGRIFAHLKAQQVAKEKAVAVAAPDEKTSPFWDGKPETADYARKALEKAPELMRLVPLANIETSDTDWQKKSARERVLGSELVTLVVTDKKALEAKIGKPRDSKGKGVREADLKERQRRQEETDRRKKAEQRHKWDQCVDLVRNVVRLWSIGISVDEPVATLVMNGGLIREDDQLCGDLGKYKAVKGRAKTEYILRLLLAADIDLVHWNPDPQVCRDNIAEFASDMKLKLPVGWDAVLTADKPKPNGKAIRETVNQEAKQWLVNTPASDINFKTTLGEANAATLKAALAHGIASNTAQSKIEARLRKLERSTVAA